jgi:hypothetical protein
LFTEIFREAVETIKSRICNKEKKLVCCDQVFPFHAHFYYSIGRCSLLEVVRKMHFKIFKYIHKFEFIFEKAQDGCFNEKNRGRKSRDTVPLTQCQAVWDDVETTT